MSNGIDFVIGGKDQAKPAMSSVEKSLTRLEQKTDSLKKSTLSLSKVTGALAAAYVAVKAGVALLGGLDKVNAAYGIQTKSVKDLTSALKARGGGSAEQIGQLQKVAANLQKLTGVGDESTISLMATAASLGFASNKLDDAAKAAIGLSDVTGKSLEGSLSDVKAALQGNFSAFTQLNPQIMYMRSNQEKLAAVMAIAQQGLQQQSENLTTVEGSGKRASGALGDLMETVGAIIAPIRVLISAGIQQLSESFQSLLIPVAQYATEVLEDIGPMMDWVKEKIVQGINIVIGAFTFFETILLNLGDVWEYAKAYAETAMIGIIESVKHALTVAIPEYAKWFGTNFVGLIKDAFNGVVTVITNAGKIIGETVYQIFAFIASGGEGGISGLMANMGHAASISLLDGFESSLTSLPEIATRKITERERDLADKMGEIGGRLGAEFSDKMKDRIVGVGTTLTDEMDIATRAINLKGTQDVMGKSVAANESRLLSRGPGMRENLLDQIKSVLLDIRGNTKGTTRMVPQI
jgi:phage-related minor tail protein